MMRWFSLWTCFCFAVSGMYGIIIPDEFPTALSVIYSNIPTIKLGTDSRIGLGFRLGDRADAQILLELGLQQETQKLGNQQLFDNPNYPEISSSSDSEETEDETSEVEEVAKKEDQHKNETEIAVIKVEIEAMGNLLSKLYSMLSVDQTEKKGYKVIEDLMHTLEGKLNEEKAKLKNLEEDTTSSIQEQVEPVRVEDELKQIISKVKYYIDKTSRNIDNQTDYITAVQIDTLKELIHRLSDTTNVNNDQNISVNFANEEKENREVNEEEIELEGNREEEFKSINSNSTEEKMETKNIEGTINDSRLNNTDKNLKQKQGNDTESSNSTTIGENIIEGNKEFQKENSHNESNSTKNNEEQDEKADNMGSTVTILPKVDETSSDTTKVETKKQLIISQKDQIKENRKFQEGQQQKPTTLEKKKYSNKTRDQNRINTLDKMIKKLKIKLNNQLEHFNENKEDEKQEFMKNLRILKILKEKRTKEFDEIKHDKFEKRFVNIKSYETLSALWVEQKTNKSKTSSDPMNRTENIYKKVISDKTETNNRKIKEEIKTERNETQRLSYAGYMNKLRMKTTNIITMRDKTVLKETKNIQSKKGIETLTLKSLGGKMMASILRVLQNTKKMIEGNARTRRG